MHSQSGPDKVIIRSPQDVAALMMPKLRYEKKEKFAAVFLSTKNHVLASPVISVGTINASVVQPRDLFREAINYNAFSVILVHNHPERGPVSE